jgi:chorismate dehydratase
MMALTPRIAAVSYLNTIPFIYGIQHAGSLQADLLLTPPAICAKNFIEGNADIALLPSAVVPELRSFEMLTDYCIGAQDEVRTVVVVSNTPIEEAHRIWLDSHSRTSVQLVGYLAAKWWKIAPQWLSLDDYSVLDTPQDGDAFLLIGDKVFDHEDEFIFSYDLASEWHSATDLPFAFAVWVARKGTPYELTDALASSLTFGVEHIYEAILDSEYRNRPYAYDYLTHNIDFLFDNEKHKALQKFWTSGIKVTPRVEPG